MTQFPVACACLLACLALAGGARADLRDDIALCATIPDDGPRLACFDDIADKTQAALPDGLDAGERRALETALQREFRFDPGLKTGTFSFRIAVSGDLQISRSTAAASEIERLIQRIAKAFGDFNGWGVTATVHGGSVALSRGRPYSGEELAQQAQAGLTRSGLGSDRYTIEIGPPAQPLLWDDGRVRAANEHIDVVITGIE
jgi:hypothetical protein